VDDRLLSVPLKLAEAESLLVEEALRLTGSMVKAAGLLGITRHGLKRRMVKHGLESVDGRRSRPEASP
jgi:DNA-binding protein Fis